jgi:hypothetical protein
VTVTFHISVAGVLKWSRRCCATGSGAGQGEGVAYRIERLVKVPVFLQASHPKAILLSHHPAIPYL